MKQKFEGIRYDYIIELDHGDDESHFEIKSMHKPDGCKSCITNVNYVLSEFVLPILNPNDLDEYEVDFESTIVASHAEGEALFQNAVSFFQAKTGLEWLEKELDNDKNLGGWNAEFEF